jgi:7-carboxy-7-deazaguanine synthase
MLSKLKICEIFYSVQGEGINMGMPMVFVRLYGCSMQCHFCDTKISWKSGIYKEMTTEEVMEAILQFNCRNVCITGGEPMEQNIDQLCQYLMHKKYYFTLETNGSFYRSNAAWLFSWVTLSPKKEIDCEWFLRTNELKIVIQKGTKEEFDKTITIAKQFNGHVHLFLQPRNNDKDIAHKINDFILSNTSPLEFRLGFQLHKFFKIQ